jgi:hypothetical protein
LLSYLDLDQYKSAFTFDETDNDRQPTISPARRLEKATTDERVSFTLKTEGLDQEKDEIVYNCISNRT